MSSLNKNINTVKCSTEGCDNKARYRGLCRRHNVQPHMLKTCATEGCDKLVGATGGKGHCIMHYVKPAQLEKCSIDGCDNNVWIKGLCRAHYVLPSQLEICSIDRCNNNVYRKGLCGTHELRMRRKGTTEPPELNQQTTHGYIIHDKAGTSLYVGITCSFNRRMHDHEHTQTWGPYVNIPEQPTATFDNREQASEWEQQTIAKLIQTTPLFNRDHNPNWSLEYEHDLLERTIDVHVQHTLLRSMVESHT